MSDPDLIALVHRYMLDTESAWSIAVFGAIAEFHADDGSVPDITLTDTGGTVLTPTGGMRIALLPQVRFVPYEILTKRRDYWMQGANFCLPAAVAAGPARMGITALGADQEALRVQDRASRLFDLGLGLISMEALVRSDDPALIEFMESMAGLDLLSGVPQAQQAFARIAAASPHRIFCSRLGRVEVFSPIPPPDGVTSPGPHTHILPHLLAAQQTQSANVPVPDGYIPCLQLFPPNPILCDNGDARPALDRAGFDDFQALIERFALPELRQAKQRARKALADGTPPPEPITLTRHERTAIRVALRQYAALGEESPVLALWHEAFEPMGVDLDDTGS